MKITAERLRELLIYDPDTGAFTRRMMLIGRCPVGSIAGSKNRLGYQQLILDHQSYLAHRIAWLYMYGRWPQGELDHVNGNRSDNRLSNIREATRGNNRANSGVGKNNKSGLKGAYWHVAAQRWSSSITVDGSKRWLGLFDTAEAAHAAYASAAKTFHGTFARTK